MADPLDPITAALNIGGKLIERIFPDPTEKAKAQIALLEMTQRGDLAEFTGRAEIVKAEAQSASWLTSNWRPITMLTFVSLIVARWFGLSASNLTEPEYLELWSIVKLGLGGYVIGRSAEKIAPQIASALAGGRQ